MEIVAGIAAALAVLALAAWAWQRRTTRADEPPARPAPPPPPPRLNPEEFAYLVGGPTRVVECAIAALVADDLLRVSREGWLTRTGRPRPTTLTEQAVLANVGEGRNVGHVVLLVRRSAAVTYTGQRLRSQGVVTRLDVLRTLRTGRGAAPATHDWSTSRYAREGRLDAGIFAVPAGIVAARGLAAFPDERAEGLVHAEPPRERTGRSSSCGGWSYGGCGGGDSGGGSSCSGGGSCGGGCGGS